MPILRHYDFSCSIVIFIVRFQLEKIRPNVAIRYQFFRIFRPIAIFDEVSSSTVMTLSTNCLFDELVLTLSILLFVCNFEDNEELKLTTD